MIILYGSLQLRYLNIVHSYTYGLHIRIPAPKNNQTRANYVSPGKENKNAQVMGIGLYGYKNKKIKP